MNLNLTTIIMYHGNSENKCPVSGAKNVFPTAFENTYDLHQTLL